MKISIINKMEMLVYVFRSICVLCTILKPTLLGVIFLVSTFTLGGSIANVKACQQEGDRL